MLMINYGRHGVNHDYGHRTIRRDAQAERSGDSMLQALWNPRTGVFRKG